MKNYLFLLLTMASCSAVTAQWTVVPSGMTDKIEAIHFFDAQHGLCSGKNAAQLVTSDGGATWSSTSFSGISGYDFPDAHTGYAIGTWIRKTTDGGATWSDLKWQFGNQYSISVINPTTAFFGGSFGNLYKTADGDTVYQWPDLPTYASTEISFSDQQTGIGVTPEGNILRTTNGGFSWTVAYGNEDVILRSLCRVDDQLVYVTATGAVLKTTDNGITWTKYDIPGSNYYEMHFYDADHGTAVGFGGSIGYTADGGVTWESQNSGTTAHLRNVRMLGPVSAVVVGDDGTILKNNFEQPAPAVSGIYPNPFTDELTVRLAGLQYLTLYDAAGKELAATGILTGSETIVLECPDVSAGVYFAEIGTASGILREKVVKK
jgi:photosystem II stability/assembly factor-like uncharacterized protein